MRRITPLVAVIVLAAMGGTLRSWSDYDIFWHLANGRILVEEGRYPSPDIFSWSMRGSPYIGLSAPVEAGYYLLWRWGGVALLALGAVALYGIAMLPYAVLIAQLRLRPLIEMVALVGIALSIGAYRGARPHMAAFALFGVIILLLGPSFSARKALGVGLVLGLWSHLHGTFILGFAAVGSVALAWLYDRDWLSLRRMAGAILLGFVISLASPQGIGLWLAPLHTAQSIAGPLMRLNTDWVPLQPFTAEGAIFMLICLAAIATGVVRRGDARVFAAMVLIPPAILAARLTPFAGPPLIVLVCQRLAERWPSVHDSSAVSVLLDRRSVQMTCWAVLGAGSLALLPFTPRTIEEASLPAVRSYPRMAVARLLACTSPAPVWNDYNWGGYLIWYGQGRYPVAIDGRAETLYSAEVLARFHAVLHRSARWQQIVQRSPAQYALLMVEHASMIDALPGWRRVYADDVAVIGVRSGVAWTCETTAAGRSRTSR